MVLLPEHSAEIEARRDEADLVAYPMRNRRGLRVVEDDAFLAIDPARLADDVSEDGIKAEHSDFVHKRHLLGIEDLALPGEDVDELGDLRREGRARRNDCRAFPLAVWNGAGFDAREEVAELGFAHDEQLFDIERHCGFLGWIVGALNRKRLWKIGGEDEVVDDCALPAC